jgi:hypothetical protein
MDKSELASYNLVGGTPATAFSSGKLENERESPDKENLPVRNIQLVDQQLSPAEKTPLKPRQANVQQENQKPLQKPARLFEASYHEQVQDPPTPSTTSFSSWNTPPHRQTGGTSVEGDEKSKLSLQGIPIFDKPTSMGDEEIRLTHRPSKVVTDEAVDEKIPLSIRPNIHGHQRRVKHVIIRPSRSRAQDTTVRDSPPTVVAVHKKNIVPLVEDDSLLHRRLAQSMLIAETYRCKLGKAEAKIASLFRDLEEARRSVHTLVSRNLTLAAKLKTKNVECDETMVPRASLFKACVYMSPVFVICGGFEHYLLTIVLLWLLLELEAAKVLKQEDETVAKIQPREVRRPTNSTMIATIPEMIELRSVASTPSVLSV